MKKLSYEKIDDSFKNLHCVYSLDQTAYRYKRITSYLFQDPKRPWCWVSSWQKKYFFVSIIAISLNAPSTIFYEVERERGGISMCTLYTTYAGWRGVLRLCCAFSDPRINSAYSGGVVVTDLKCVSGLQEKPCRLAGVRGSVSFQILPVPTSQTSKPKPRRSVSFAIEPCVSRRPSLKVIDRYRLW